MGSGFYGLATVEGLHLTCDFVVYSSALFGCPPDYCPTPVGLHDSYREPYEVLAGMPFSAYKQFATVNCMDNETLDAISCVLATRMKDFTCLAWEIDPQLFGRSIPHPIDASILGPILRTAEQILDMIRLFLFVPGENSSIGRAGAVGGGVSGVWFGDQAGDGAYFVARKTSAYHLVQRPMQRGLADVRRIYADPIFRELCSVVCSGPGNDPILAIVLQSLRAFRESRDIPSAEARFLRLASIAEHLARGKSGERLKGPNLRSRIAEIAGRGWRKNTTILQTTTDLWDNARNPLTHSTETFPSLSRSGDSDIAALEGIVINMIEAVVIQWRNEGL